MQRYFMSCLPSCGYKATTVDWPLVPSRVETQATSTSFEVGAKSCFGQSPGARCRESAKTEPLSPGDQLVHFKGNRVQQRKTPGQFVQYETKHETGCPVFS